MCFYNNWLVLVSPLASICQLAQSFLLFSRIFLIDCYLSWLIAQNAPVNMSTMACNPLIWLTYHLLISVYIHASLLLFVNLISTVVSVGRILNTSFNPPIVYLSTAIQPLIYAPYFSSQAMCCSVFVQKSWNHLVIWHELNAAMCVFY